MKCPQCGRDNQQGAPDCAACGYVFATGANKAAASQRIVCPICNTSSAPTAVYCGRCQQLLPLPQGAAYGGKYRIVRLIGQGGMGRVYLAKHSAGGHRAAIKEMVDDRGWADSERAPYIRAFQREVDVLSHLHHLRTVPQLLEPCQEWSGRRYFAMEFIEGKSLQKALDQQGGPFPPDPVIAWATQLCELLQVLHRQEPNPIVHQDLKLENIILRKPCTPESSIVLLDFGVARFVRVGTRLSVYGGTLGYAPKEQSVDRQPEPRSDLYSLSVCMHQLLTARDPTQYPAPFPPASQLNRQVPAWLSDLIAINLSEESRERYESAARLREDLLKQRVTAMIRCPACGADNERSLIYCKKCTRTLVSSSRQCLDCGQFVPANCRFCPWCGKKV